MFSDSATTVADAGRRPLSSNPADAVGASGGYGRSEPRSGPARHQPPREVREEFTAALEVLDEVDRDKSAILAAGKAADPRHPGSEGPG
jgi:hypothetical protein